MHETLIENIRGYVESWVEIEMPETNEVNYKLVGWSEYGEVKLKSIRLLEGVEGNGPEASSQVTESNVVDVSSQIPRHDVAEFYNVSALLNTGFEITLNSLPSRNSDSILQINEEGQWKDFLRIPRDLKVTSRQLFDCEVNKNRAANFLVVDNFYVDPDRVRQFALKQTFNEHPAQHKGARTEECFRGNVLRLEFERLLNKKIFNWDEYDSNGIFQYCTAEDARVYHMDSQSYAGAIYLTPDAPPECGTSFFRSKTNNLRRPPTEAESKKHGKTQEELLDEIFYGGHYDKTKFELIDTVGNVYNRLVLWDAQMIHAASEYFGNTKTNSRLFHLFFFDAK